MILLTLKVFKDPLFKISCKIHVGSVNFQLMILLLTLGALDTLIISKTSTLLKLNTPKTQDKTKNLIIIFQKKVEEVEVMEIEAKVAKINRETFKETDKIQKKST